MISEWFFQWYHWVEAPAVMGRIGFGLGILSFIGTSIYGWIDHEPDWWWDAFAVGLMVWAIVFFGSLLVPGAVGGLFWLFFL